MIDLKSLDSDILLDIRYARDDNFLGRSVYDEEVAYLQVPAAESLLKAHLELKSKGFGVVVFDGYRPWSVTKIFWETVKKEERIFVADPEVGSRHNRGCAVDLSIYHLDSGEMASMPSDFDEFNEKAHPKYEGADDESKRNRDLLIKTFESHGFTVNRNEWWHFDHETWDQYEILDVPFSSLKS